MKNRVCSAIMALFIFYAMAANAMAADYSFTTDAPQDYYGDTSYEDIYGSQYNYGGPSVHKPLCFHPRPTWSCSAPSPFSYLRRFRPPKPSWIYPETESPMYYRQQRLELFAGHDGQPSHHHDLSGRSPGEPDLRSGSRGFGIRIFCEHRLESEVVFRRTREIKNKWR